jgi:hypothetical protein
MAKGETCWLITLCLLVQTVGTAQTGRLVLTDHVTMLSCDPVSTAPCFRLSLKAVGADRTPVSLPLPPEGRLVESLTIHVDNQDLKPFYASATNAQRAPSRNRIVLILIDISGSMNKRLPTGETRFEAAKAAVSQFLQGFEPGVDRVAILPFESHKVVETIRSARFLTTLSDTQRQLESLPKPQSRNNTALYTAVDEGLELLQHQLESGTNAEAQLFILTDGENEVYPERGDDPGLLAGDEGLHAVVDKVNAYKRVTVTAVGFGDAREVDQEALKAMSNHFRMVTDAEALKRAFSHPPAKPVASDIAVGFTLPWADRASLTARTLYLRVSLVLPTGENLESDETQWSSPEMGMPLFEGRCNNAEIGALMEASKAAAPTGWLPVLRPVLVFVGLGGLLLTLWLWIPRLIWADQYLGGIATPARARWASATSSSQPPHVAASRRAPPGFESAEDGGAVPRAPVDATRVLPSNLTTTRIRLERRKPPENR